MRILLVTVLLSSVICLGGDAPEPKAISTKVAKPGDTFSVTGIGLGAANVDEIYLTDHKFDMKVKVLDQKENLITVRVPPFAKPGRVQLLILTKGAEPMLLEQPLYLMIEEATTQIGEVKAEPKRAAEPKQ